MVSPSYLHMDTATERLQSAGCLLLLIHLLILLAAMNEVPNEGMLDRHIEWIVECKDAVQALRLTTKQAKAHREKCCSVLGAALAAALALEQAIYSCALNVAKSQELQRLYAAVVAAVELAQQRVQVSSAHMTQQPALASISCCARACQAMLCCATCMFCVWKRAATKVSDNDA